MTSLANIDKLPIGAELVIANNANGEAIAKVVHVGGGMVRVWRVYVAATSRTKVWKPSEEPGQTAEFKLNQTQLDRMIEAAR